MGVALARLHHQLDPRRFFTLEDDREAGYASWLLRESASRRAVVLVAVSGSRGTERILGYTYGRLEGRDWASLRDPAGFGIDVFVEPRSRARGVGRQLAEALVAELVRRGAPRVIIQVAAKNDRALRAFEELGFRRTLIELTIEAPGAGEASSETARKPRATPARTGRSRSRKTSSPARPRRGSRARPRA
jgi:ribosomal protein S18 acetylase RimI-like enzyme